MTGRIVDSVHQAFIIHAGFYYLIVNFGDITAVAPGNWWISQLVSLTRRVYYAHEYKLSGVSLYVLDLSISHFILVLSYAVVSSFSQRKWSRAIADAEYWSGEIQATSGFLVEWWGFLQNAFYQHSTALPASWSGAFTDVRILILLIWCCANYITDNPQWVMARNGSAPLL